MAQPIKKIIQEVHKEEIKEKPFYTLLIDGGSLLFHCMKDDKVTVNGLHYGGIYQFLLQIRMQLQKADYQYVYVFFDDEYSGLLRWRIYKDYKANRDKHYEDYAESDYMKEVNKKVSNMMAYFKSKKGKVEKGKTSWEKLIDDNFVRERDELCRIFSELFIRWEIDEITEGDDLIAYYCKNKKENEKIVIMTGDMDLSQLLAEDICIYNLDLKKYITKYNFISYYNYPHDNIVVKKIFCGDTSDNIGNIKGLSEKGFYEIMPEAKTHKVTINEVKERAKSLIDERISKKKKPLKVHENIIDGISNKEYEGDFYEINKSLIDLSEPKLSEQAKEDMDNMMYAPQDPEGRSLTNVYEIIQQIGIMELMGDTKFASFFSPFKRLMDKEKEMFEEFEKK